jgi:hypothetical protein
MTTQIVSLLVGARGGYSFRALGERVLKGFEAPVAVVEVKWTTAPAVVPLPEAVSAADRGPHVGRADALDQLRHAWEGTAEKGTRVVVVGGEPGIGKTRLVGALAADVHRVGGIVLWGSCDEELTAGYEPVVDGLRHLLEHLRPDELESLAPKPELGRLVPELRDRLPGLGEPVAGDPDAERLASFEAVRELLCAAATQVGPVLLVLDDAHWAPAPTLLLFRHLAQAEGSCPILLVATYRETELDRVHPFADLLADLRRRDDVERVRLAGLDDDAVADLVEELAGHQLDGEARSMAAVVRAETEGNPFFVVQVLRHLAESGVLVRSGDRWTSPMAIAEFGIPEGVKEVIGRRLSRLPPAGDRAVAVAAAVGREFDLEMIEQLLDNDSNDVLDGLDAAVAARLIDQHTAAIDGLTTRIEVMVEPFCGARDLIVTIPGISTGVADVIIAETGADMTRFPSAGHLASWAGTTPGSNESAGRIKSTHTRPGSPYLKGALGVAAMSAARTNGTYLSAKYRRIAARRGPVKAIVAVEHAMLIAIWNMLSTGTLYNDPGADFYTRLNPDKAKNRALDQLRKMGYDVTLNPLAAAG